MQILAINCGSASLKFAVWHVEPPEEKKSRLEGKVAWTGQDAVLRFVDSEGVVHERRESVADHAEAVDRVVELLQSLVELGTLHAIGHRIVHGGPKFHQAVRINDDVLCELAEMSVLAPLHNPAALSAVHRTRQLLGASMPMVAVFDTAFHRHMPPKAEFYPLNRDLSGRLGLRRYGFHGIAHRYMADRGAQLMQRPLEALRLITLQLGNGCSAAAIERGRSVDTSMGFTPLEGLMMGTRSGDLDPGLVSYLMRHEIKDVARLETMLNEQCGLLGVSGRTHDMRELLEAETAGDERARLAIDMFCYRIRKYIGAYLAVLGGADAILFGGGIGENSADVRRRSCEGLQWAGLSLDPVRNRDADGVEAKISVDGAAMDAYVITVREELLIARETAALLGT
jgi:acetate kinase